MSRQRSRASAFRIWQQETCIQIGDDALRTVTSTAMTPVCGQRDNAIGGDHREMRVHHLVLHQGRINPTALPCLGQIAPKT
jgi:hypothetical protein